MIFGALNNTRTDIFDSATPAQAKQAVQELSTSEIREQQSTIEHFRQEGLMIVLSTADAVTNGGLEDTELAIDVLDESIAESLDGIADDEDSTATDLLMGAISDAFGSLGVDDTTINEIFSDDIDVANSALETACEMVVANLPDDGEPLNGFIREFIFGDGEDGFDSADDETAEYDAVKAHTKAGKARLGAFSQRKVGGKTIRYRGVKAVRHGKIVVVNKRFAGQGKIRLSAKQRAGLKKARAKAQTANALKMRIRSLRKGHKAGIYKGM